MHSCTQGQSASHLQRRRTATPGSVPAVTFLLVFVTVAIAGAYAWQHEAAPRPATETGQPHQESRAEGHPPEAEQHSEGVFPAIARLLNFALLAGTLAYFLKAPIANYLVSRGAQIRQELVTAKELRDAATAQLAELARKLEALPGELEALKARGAEDVRAERARIEQAAGAERTRVLEQMRREIDMRLRIARRELIEHAARLAVQVAESRIVHTISPADQLRLVDRYATQLREPQ
jgi:F-type H+-transporting ATPase subunit b